MTAVTIISLIVSILIGLSVIASALVVLIRVASHFGEQKEAQKSAAQMAERQADATRENTKGLNELSGKLGEYALSTVDNFHAHALKLENHETRISALEEARD